MFSFGNFRKSIPWLQRNNLPLFGGFVLPFWFGLVWLTIFLPPPRFDLVFSRLSFVDVITQIDSLLHRIQFPYRLLLSSTMSVLHKPFILILLNDYLTFPHPPLFLLGPYKMTLCFTCSQDKGLYRSRLPLNHTVSGHEKYVMVMRERKNHSLKSKIIPTLT